MNLKPNVPTRQYAILDRLGVLDTPVSSQLFY